MKLYKLLVYSLFYIVPLQAMTLEEKDNQVLFNALTVICKTTGMSSGKLIACTYDSSEWRLDPMAKSKAVLERFLKDNPITKTDVKKANVISMPLNNEEKATWIKVLDTSTEEFSCTLNVAHVLPADNLSGDSASCQSEWLRNHIYSNDGSLTIAFFDQKHKETIQKQLQASFSKFTKILVNPYEYSTFTKSLFIGIPVGLLGLLFCYIKWFK